MPIRPVSWLGGENYLKLIRAGVQQIQENSQVKLVKEYPRLRKILTQKRLYKFSSIFLKLLDLFRANGGINLTWAVSPTSRYILRWIPDFQDLIYPEFFSPDEREQRKTSINKSILHGHALYFSSEDSRTIFIQNYGDVSNVQGIVRFASSQYLESEETLPQSKIDCADCIKYGFFYMPNQWWKHKNHLLTIKAFLAYRDKGGKKHLVLTGTEYDYRYPDLAREIRSSISEHLEIHPLGVVSRQYQKELFKTADLLIQPSICEGWSTTIEEGLYFGVPILASNINVNMEQLEGCKDAFFFDPSSLDDLALKLNFKIYKIESDALNLRRAMREQRFKNDLKRVIESTYKFISEEKT